MTGVTDLQSIDGGSDSSTSTTNRTKQFTSTITAGSRLFAAFSTFNTNPSNLSVSDDKGNTWILIGQQYDSNSRGAALYYCVANAGSIGAQPTVTFNKNGQNCMVGCSIYERGTDPTVTLDVTPVTGTNVNSGPAEVTLGSTVYTNDEIFAVLGIEQAAYVTCTPLSGYSNVVSNTNANLQHIVATKATTTTGVNTPGWTLSAPSHWNVVAVALRGTTTAPTITGLSSALGSTSVADGATLTINGSNFGASQGAGSVTVGGTTCTVTSWGASSIQVTAAIGSNAYGTSLNVQVNTNSSGSSNLFAMTGGVVPPSGYSYVNIGTPNLTANYRLTSTGGGDLASGDQVEYGNLVGTGTVTVGTDGVPVWDPTLTSYDYRVWTSGSGWGSWATEQLQPSISSVSVAVWMGL